MMLCVFLGQLGEEIFEESEISDSHCYLVYMAGKISFLYLHNITAKVHYRKGTDMDFVLT